MSGEELIARLRAVEARIRAAAERGGRDPAGVALVGVAKRVPAERVAEAAGGGLARVGENYVQEAREKIPRVSAVLAAAGRPPPRWHFVGQLQRNKARDVARLFDVVETIDRQELGRELDRRAAHLERTLDVLLQVNLSGEPQKGGASRAELPALVAAADAWPNLRVIGLMTLPAADADPEASRPVFAELRALCASLREAPGGARLRELSMGMSGDFEVAVEEGATIVRVGTAIFGPRAAR